MVQWPSISDVIKIASFLSSSGVIPLTYRFFVKKFRNGSKNSQIKASKPMYVAFKKGDYADMQFIYMEHTNKLPPSIDELVKVFSSKEPFYYLQMLFRGRSDCALKEGRFHIKSPQFLTFKKYALNTAVILGLICLFLIVLPFIIGKNDGQTLLATFAMFLPLFFVNGFLLTLATSALDEIRATESLVQME